MNQENDEISLNTGSYRYLHYRYLNKEKTLKCRGFLH